jgi:hypothetical protein
MLSERYNKSHHFALCWFLKHYHPRAKFEVIFEDNSEHFELIAAKHIQDIAQAFCKGREDAHLPHKVGKWRDYLKLEL